MMYWSDHMGTSGWIFSIVWTVIILAILVAATECAPLLPDTASDQRHKRVSS